MEISFHIKWIIHKTNIIYSQNDNIWDGAPQIHAESGLYSVKPSLMITPRLI